MKETRLTPAEVRDWVARCCVDDHRRFCGAVGGKPGTGEYDYNLRLLVRQAARTPRLHAAATEWNWVRFAAEALRHAAAHDLFEAMP